VQSTLDSEQIDRLFRSQASRAVATLARIFNDLDRAEDAVQDAYAQALDRWPRYGLPENPAAWIVVSARNAAIDALRRERTADAKRQLLANLEALVHADTSFDGEAMDDRLAMIFAACHPALNEETRIALTLRFAAGLTVAEISSALLVPQPTVAQRLVRAKHKIKRARIAFAIPEVADLSERLHDVLRVIYLIFNEGYASWTHADLVRADLCEEALRLAELLGKLLPGQAEVSGLHALVLFHDARRATRVDESGEPVLLERQDRSLWDQRKIERGTSLLEGASWYGAGPYLLQAMIAREHATATTWEATNWRRILDCYESLIDRDPSPVVQLNRAVALAYAHGPELGLTVLDALGVRGVLAEYAPFFAARAELLRRVGRCTGARAAYSRAIELTESAAERRFLQRRLADLTSLESLTS
jgi:RNA polymerase sigma-70 factor (ECF subfamily)